jgi:molybdenum cofactor cytidylyltransferase
MRATFEVGLDWLEARGQPPEAVLLVPADSPRISIDLIGQILSEFRAHGASMVVPTHHGRRGHPLLLAWDRALGVRALPPGIGINFMLRDPNTRLAEVEVDDEGCLHDLDTPDDYRRSQARAGDEIS